ncbi:MAG: carboxypeptidase regulatory-like domain-containing protein [Acidobacteriia bacterium]|nr:carboxypeptidase regulatory-like domain-containing protein [Terriglobia bacterium]
MTRPRVVLAATLFSLAIAVAAPARAAGSAAGTVVDRDGPLPGATVVLAGAALPAAKSALTDAKGFYRFQGIPAGTYEITAFLGDGQKFKLPGVQVANGSETRVPAISLFVETVQVTGKSLDVVTKDTTTSGETFEAEKIATLPTGRSYTDLLKIAPGVSGDDGSGGQSVYGATGLESSYLIDGVNTTSVESGRPSKEISFDLIDKMELKTGGYEAEFGGAQGAIVNVTTKSGSNEFTGALSFYDTPASLSAAPARNGFGTELPVPNDREISTSVGGPIVRDRLFFFAAVSRKNSSRVAPQADLSSVLGETVQGATRRFAEDSDEADLYSLKLTWQPAGRNRVVATLMSDPRLQNLRDELGGYGGDHEVRTGGTTASVQLSSILSKRWLLEAQVGTHSENDRVLPTLERRSFNPVGEDRRLSYASVQLRGARGADGTTLPGEPSLKYGPYAYSGEMNGDRQFAKAAAEASFLRHTVKFGAEYEISDYEQSLDYGWGTGMALEWSDITDRDPATGAPRPGRQTEELVGVRRCWGDGQGDCVDWNHQVRARGATGSLRLFAQDQWKPASTVTLNYGLRWEQQDIRDAEGSVLGKMKDNLAPRLGFAWDVLGDDRSKLYFSAGRFYDTVPMQVVSRAFAPRILMTRLYRSKNWTDIPTFLNTLNALPGSNYFGVCPVNDPIYDQGSSTCWDFESKDLWPDPFAYATKKGILADKVHSPDGLNSNGTPVSFVPEVVVNSGSLNRSPIDPDLKGTSTDEVTVGYDWEFRDGWMAGARAIGRRLNEAIEDMSLDFGKTYVIANPGGPYRFYADPSNLDLVNPRYVPGSADPSQAPGLAQRFGCEPGAVCAVRNDDLEAAGLGAFPKATRTFRGVELTLSRKLRDKYWFNLSYLYSRTFGNYRGRYFAESEERDPNVTEAFDVPALVVNSTGLLPQDKTHQVKLYGSYRVTPSVSLGAAYRFATGSPISATTDPAGGSTPFFGPIFLLERGSVGRTPSLRNLDANVAWEIRDAGRAKLSMYLDVFNLLNEQKPVRVDEQFLAVGQPKAVIYPGLGAYISQGGRGEPLDLYLDQKFGNKDGRVTPNEWNAWANSLNGAFGSLRELYAYLKNETVPDILSYDSKPVPAFPGFANCPASLPADPTECPALNAGFGRAKEIEAPRSIRVGIRLTF